MEKRPIGETLAWALPVIAVVFLLGTLAYVTIPPAITRYRTMLDRLPKLIDDKNWPLIERGLLLPCRPKAEVAEMQNILLQPMPWRVPLSIPKAITMANGNDDNAVTAFQRLILDLDESTGETMEVLSHGQRHFNKIKGTKIAEVVLQHLSQLPDKVNNKILLEAIKLPQEFQSAFRLAQEFVKRLNEISFHALPYYAQAFDHLVGIADNEGKSAILDFLRGHNAPEAPAEPMD